MNKQKQDKPLSGILSPYQEKETPKGFTLVELIVVITILAILGTIAFISLQGYSRVARDSTRISDLSKIKSSLELFQLNAGKYPEVTNGKTITYGGLNLWNQGSFGESTFRNVEKLDKIPKDPITNKEYTYSLTNSKQEYQLAGILEGSDYGLINNKNIYAGNNEAYIKIVGNYNGKILKANSGSTLYVLAVPSLISSEGILLSEIITNKTLAYDGYKNLPSSFSGSNYNILGETDLDLVNEANIVIFSGTTEELSEESEDGELIRAQLVTNLQSAYNGTVLADINEIGEILDVRSVDIESLATVIVKNNLGGDIDIKEKAPACIDSQTPTPDQYFTFDESSKTITGYDVTGGLDVVIPCQINNVDVKAIGSMSFFNKGLTSVLLNENIEIIKSFSFPVNKLTTITIPNSVKKIENQAFVGNSLLSNAINYDGYESNEYIYSPYNEGIDIIYHIGNIPDTLILPSYINGKKVKRILSDAFPGGIKNLTLPDGITDIYGTSFGNTLESVINYDGEESSEYIYIPYNDGISIVDYIGNSKDIIIPTSINGKNVLSIGPLAFYLSSNIETLILPDGLEKIGGAGFFYNKLSNVIIPNTVTYIGSIAFKDNSLTSVTIPDSVTSLGDSCFNDQANSIGGGTVYGPGSGYIFDIYNDNTSNVFDKTKLSNYVVQP